MDGRSNRRNKAAFENSSGVVWTRPKGPGKRGHNVADTLLPMMFLGRRKLGNICRGHKMFLNKIKALKNEDTLLRTHCCRQQMFPRLPARATFVADTKFVFGTQKMSLILFRNILCPQQMFPSLRSPRNIMGNNVSPTMCPRLPGPLETFFVSRTQNLCPQQMLYTRANGDTFVSATMCPQQCVLVCQGLKKTKLE